MKITPFSANCGATVEDFQLASMTDDELANLRRAFTQHGLLFFRNQELSPEEHLHFARRFGSIVVNKFFKTTKEHPEIAEVRKEKTQQTNIGGGWHADHSYDDEPAMGSILVARVLPKTGGNTHFANLYAAYEALPSSMQERLAAMRAIHSNKHLYGENGLYRLTDLADQLGGMDRVGDATHPVVITHPESGRKALYVSPRFTIGIEGLPDEEAQGLLEELFEHMTRPEFIYHHRWRLGDLLFWDNRCLVHLACRGIPEGQIRHMHRTTVSGDVPF